MNTTIVDGIEGTQDNHIGEKTFETYGYGIGFSLLILVILILITYSSYLYIGKRSSTNDSSSHNIVNNNTTIVENQLIFIQQGLDETTLRNYPKLLYSQAKSNHNKKEFLVSSGCSICLVDYKDNDKLRLLPDCRHIFHVKCIDTWLRLHPTCPNCRSSPFPSPLPTPLAEVVPLATRQS